ncbi:hypothetical protein EJV47_24660 [Hymenobacter gummosus]|uniref:Uncharacterized protein n=1 Tax=Hymenobacter gummosus TaxID=1776032 RepID=A0A431TW81_9BACT|nr:hypothetical protein [Hymenobacter gummosus]RTQ45680.1 hypothetical protein EJV47_24660 [Hymenobacter gummosus]
MGTTKKAPRYIIADEQQNPKETVMAVTAEELLPELDDSLCSCCGEPLAWHEAACVEPAAISVAAEPAPALLGGAAAAAYAYQVGQPVQPAFALRAHKIIWRGQLKERHPRTGWVHRINVYRLDDGHWDCYREDELQAA